MRLIYFIILALLVSACATPTQGQEDQPGQRAEVNPLGGQLEFDDERTWSGSVKISGRVPEGVELSVVLEVIVPGERKIFHSPGWREIFVIDQEAKTSFDGHELFQSVARVSLGRELVFRLPVVVSAPPRSLFRIRPVGEYLVSSGLLFTLADETVPKFNQPLVVEATVGYAAELRLVLPAGTTDEEHAALVGRTLSFEGQSEGRSASYDYVPALELETRIHSEEGQLVARLDGIGLQPLSYLQPHDTTFAKDSLAPFHISEIPVLKPTPGELVTVEVKLARGITLAGRVEDQGGHLLKDAAIDIIGPRHRDPALPLGAHDWRATSQWLRVKTDAEGQFLARAVPEDFTGLRVSVLNKRYLQLSAEDVPAAMRSDLRLVVEDGFTLWGRAILPDGRPLVETAVQFELPKTSHRWGAISALTDAEGRFRVEGILDDEIQFAVDGWRMGNECTLASPRGKEEKGIRWVAGSSARATSTSEAQPFDVIVRPAGTIRGRVLRNGVQSLDDCYVWVGAESLVQQQHQFAERTSNFSAKRFPIDPATGTFEVTEFAMGPVGVFAQVGLGRNARSSQLVTFDAAAIPGSIELNLK